MPVNQSFPVTCTLRSVHNISENLKHNFALGTTVHPQCSHGYKYRGPQQLTCACQGWDKDVGTCMDAIGNDYCVPEVTVVFCLFLRQGHMKVLRLKPLDAKQRTWAVTTYLQHRMQSWSAVCRVSVPEITCSNLEFFPKLFAV